MRRNLQEPTKFGIGRGDVIGTRQWTTEVEPIRTPELIRMLVVSAEVGGAHNPRVTNIEHSPLTQPKAKDGASDKEPDKLHEKGRVNGLVGKQERKQTKLEGNASNSPKSQVKVAESILWQKCIGFLKREEKAGSLEVCPSLVEHVGPYSSGANASRSSHIGPNLEVSMQAQLSMVMDKIVMPHQTPTNGLEPLKPSPVLQGRKWIRIDRPA